MTDRDAMKVVQSEIRHLANQELECLRNLPEIAKDAFILSQISAWESVHRAATVHIEGVFGLDKQGYSPKVAEQLERDPFEDNGDPPAVRDAKEKCKNLLHPGTDPADVDRNLTRFF